MKVQLKKLLAESLPDAKDVEKYLSAKSGIHIKPSKKGTFTSAASKHGKGVQAFASQVLSHKGNYSAAMVKKANFARNASKWHHGDAGIPIPTKVPLSGEDYLTTLPSIPERLGLNINVDDRIMPNHGSITEDTLTKQSPDLSALYKGLGASALALDAILPVDKPQRQYVQPKKVYNDHPYGTGSQALMDGGGEVPPQKSAAKYIAYKDPKDPNRKLVIDLTNQGGIMNSDGTKGKGSYNYKNLNGSRGILFQEDLDNIMRDLGTNPILKNGILLGEGMKFGESSAATQNFKQGGIIPDKDSNFYTGKRAKAGSTLTPSKAKEILNDGTAQGHPLTDKQKKYFGWIAGGSKGDAGLTLGGDDIDPKNALKSPQDLHGYDLFNYVVSSGVDPRKAFTDADGKPVSLYNNLQGLLPEEDAKKLYESAFITYQNKDYKNLSPQDRLKTFYNSNNTDTHLQALKDKIKNYTGTNNALSAYSTSPNIEVKKQLGTMEKGGTINNRDGIQTHWGGYAEQISNNPHDGGTMKFNGDSHAEGGIGLTYNGKGVEVEGGETAVRDADGTLNIMGNMTVPGSSSKFKSLSKKIADKEDKYSKLSNNGVSLINENDSTNKFGSLKFNAGKIMMEGANLGLQDLAKKKEILSSVQNEMLDMADRNGIDPIAMSEGKVKKAKYGASIKAAAGYQVDGGEDPTRSDRNNNPGNLKYAGQKGAIKGQKAPDGGYYAIFPTREAGFEAMKRQLKAPSFRDLPIDEAINKWTNGKPYKYDLGSMKGKKISDLNDGEFNNLLGIMIKGEGTKYGVSTQTTSNQSYIPNIESPNKSTPPPEKWSIGDINPIMPNQTTPEKVPVSPMDNISSSDKVPKDTNQSGLNPIQILPEAYDLVSNKVQPVKAQEYDPQLFTPYQVSFQDRDNANQSTFRGLEKEVGANPEALGTLAGQMYSANNSVKADEFRTNQGITNDITNKNVSLLNDALFKNLSIRDQQYVREETAKSKTRQQSHLALESIASKELQNSLENKRLGVYENLYDYRFGPNGHAQYEGPDASFNWERQVSGSPSGDTPRTVRNYDANGNLKSYRTVQDSNTKEATETVDLQRKLRTLPLLTVPRLQSMQDFISKKLSR